ncbi:histidine phosphatase family protein [Sulfitobacter sp. UBA1132]|uniref:histidine phosphatase family protein n=1 Tax=Sulfitobacter sp. UBA1132 TaxID=1947582 RepID=UPI00257E86A5|nr:histidine phosphatase family protein [Sulfitobacter sp. UBA1132]
MGELLVIRHGQASFGADNYDKLSDLGHRQSEAVGQLLRDTGWVPDRTITGTLTRQKETLASMGFEAGDTHPGLNEYDFQNLLDARYKGAVPDLVKGDRKVHFRTLRETVFQWQADEIEGPAETWTNFTDRVEAARLIACAEGADRVLAVSSGGVIGQLTAASLGAPHKMMMTLNLQIKNTSITKFVFTKSAFFLHEFNAIPHLMSAETADMLTYS